MKILTASYILTFDENFTILKDGCIVFDEKIIELEFDWSYCGNVKNRSLTLLCISISILPIITSIIVLSSVAIL